MTLSTSSFRPLALGLAVLATLVAGEAWFRVHYFGWNAVLKPWNYSPAPLVQSKYIRAVDDPDIGWVLRPNMDGYFKGAGFATNSHGMRGPELPLKKPRGVVRIAVLGRSLTLGSGVENRQTYAAQLQKLFDEHLPGRVEILNFAVGAYRMPQMAAHYEKTGRRFDPDLVIVPMPAATFFSRVPVANELRRTGAFELRTYLRHIFIYRALRKFVGNQLRDHLASDWRQRDWQPSAAEQEQIRVSKSLGSFIAARHAEKVPVVVVIVRTLWQLPRIPRAGAKIRKWMKQQPGAVLINTDPVMKQFITAHDYIFYGDTHPNARVHAEYARVIFERLMRVMSFRRKQPSPSSDTVHRQQR